MAYSRNEWMEDYAAICALLAHTPAGNIQEIYVLFREKHDDREEADKRAKMWAQSLSFLNKNKDALIARGMVKPPGMPSEQLLHALWAWHVIYGRLHGEMPEPTFEDISKGFH